MYGLFAGRRIDNRDYDVLLNCLSKVRGNKGNSIHVSTRKHQAHKLGVFIITLILPFASLNICSDILGPRLLKHNGLNRPVFIILNLRVLHATLVILSAG